MKRTAHPPLSHAGLEALALYEHWLREREDLTVASIRNYLSQGFSQMVGKAHVKREKEMFEHNV